MQIAHRFSHHIRIQDGHKRWDWARIRRGVREGMTKAAELAGSAPITSVSCDAWAQDFGLLDAEGQLVYSPVSYRDERSAQFAEGFHERVSPERLFDRVGVGTFPITTLAQLYAMTRQEPGVLERASTLLHIADLLHHELCGVAATDRTLASASQMYGIGTDTWDRELLLELGIPDHLLPRLVVDPTVIGRISEHSAPHPGLVAVPVVIGAGHDTAAASFAAGPLDSETLFLSEGTYTMLGCVSATPLVPPDAVRQSCALVGLPRQRWGLFSTAMGLWMLQECCRVWERDGQVTDYDELVRECQAATELGAVPLDDPRLQAPANVPDAIEQVCRERGIPPPVTRGETARLVLDSMARQHRDAVSVLARLTQRKFRRIHIVSGGSRNAYFCQKLADLLGIPVVAGPAEAAVTGNILLQARAMGIVASDADVQQVIDVSFDRVCYGPSTP